MKKWEIWKINLHKAIDSNTVIQVSEDNHIRDFCIIITSQNFLDTFHAPTIIPIKVSCNANYSAITIDGNKTTGLFCESYVICDQIFTVHKDIFVKKVGIVPEILRSKIQKRIFNYLLE